MKITDQHGVLAIWRACLSPTHLLHHILDSCKELIFLLALFLEIKWHPENSDVTRMKKLTFRKKCPEEQLFSNPGFACSYVPRLSVLSSLSFICLISVTQGLDGKISMVPSALTCWDSSGSVSHM